VRAYMLGNLDRQFQLKDIAGSLGITGEHLCREFKKSAGITPFAYLREMRLARACGLLEQTDMRISAVAHRAGFSTSAQMGRVFRQSLGMSPRDYQRSNCPDELRGPNRGSCEDLQEEE